MRAGTALLICLGALGVLGVSTHSTGHHAKPAIIVPDDSDVCVPAPHLVAIVAPDCWATTTKPAPTPKPTATPKHPKGLTL